MSCCGTTRLFCGKTGCGSGRRIVARPWPCGPGWRKIEQQPCQRRHRAWCGLTGLFGLSEFVEKARPELAANAMLCAVNQAAYLLKRQLEKQGGEFVAKGGFTEKLYGARKRNSDGSDGSDKPGKPNCPRCGKPMKLRTVRAGAKAGRQFWGCAGYPDCGGTQPVFGSHRSDRSDERPKKRP